DQAQGSAQPAPRGSLRPGAGQRGSRFEVPGSVLAGPSVVGGALVLAVAVALALASVSALARVSAATGFPEELLDLVDARLVAGGLVEQPVDHGGGIVEVLADGQEVGVAPQAVAPLGAHGRAHTAPQPGGLAGPPRTELEPAERGAGLIGRHTGAPAASVTQASTQPSTRASRVSSRPSAASLTLVTLGPIASAPPESISWSLAGSCSIDGSRLEAKSSSPEVSTRMPRAYSSTVASTRARSHGAPANRRR